MLCYGILLLYIGYVTVFDCKPDVFAESQYSSIDRMDSASLSNESHTSTSLGDIPYHIVPPKPPRYAPLESQALPVLSGPLSANTTGCLSACSTRDFPRVTSSIVC